MLWQRLEGWLDLEENTQKNANLHYVKEHQVHVNEHILF